MEKKSIGAILSEGASLLEEQIRDSALDSNSGEYQELVKRALRALFTCSVHVARGDVYSANESLDEFSADRLRFVLVPFYLAELLQLQNEPGKRADNLLRARQQLKQFLDDLERLGLLAEPDLKVWKRGGTPPKDANARREEKLERGRRELANKKRLREIRARLKENEARGNEADTGIDEEMFRESVLLEIQGAVAKAFEWLDLIDQELPLVERMEQMKKLEQAKAGKNWAEPKKEERKATEPVKVDLPPGYSQTVGPAGQITIAKLPVLREQLESRVFQPGYNMATMSIEEAGERDYQEMLERTEREKQSAARKAEEPDEDNAAFYDSVTVYKDRDWDTFKDENPTGCGNTMANLGVKKKFLLPFCTFFFFTSSK